MKFDAIIIGGGHCGMAKATELQKSGLKCAVISKGRSIYGPESSEFRANGGIVLMGDEVASVDYEGGKVKDIHTVNLGEVALEAEKFFLATGKFFGGGLVADMDRVYEPVFGLDVIYEEDRSKWFSEKFADPQPFLDFGVKLGEGGCAVKSGEPVVNLFPLGEIIAKQ